MKKHSNMEHISKRLSGASAPERNQTGTPSRNGGHQNVLSKHESDFLEALGSPKLKNCSDAAIAPALRRLLVMLGIRQENYPTEEMVLLMCEGLRANHGTLTIKELALAFEMAVALKLDFNPHAFQNVSVLYLNELLTSYKKWSAQAYQQLRPGGDPAQEREKMDYTPRVYERKSTNWLKHDIELGYRNYLNGILTNYLYIPYDWHPALVEFGYIEHDPEAVIDGNPRCGALTPAEKKALNIGQQMVWLLFEMARKQKCKTLGLWVLA